MPPDWRSRFFMTRAELLTSRSPQSLLLLRRHRRQVRNHCRRTLGIAVRRPSLFQLRLRRCTLDKFSCPPLSCSDSPLACDPKRRGTLQLPDSRPDRTEVRRCPATRRSRGPRTTALRTARVAPDTSPLKGDVVAFGVAGVGIALQDERFFEAFSHCLARESGWRRLSQPRYFTVGIWFVFC